MWKKLVTIGCCAAGLCLSQLSTVQAQQPVREGLRRTGQAVTQGTRAAVRGTAEAARRTGQAARNVVRGDTQTQIRAETMTDTNPTYEGTPPENPNAGVMDTEGSIQGTTSQQQPYQSGYRGTDMGYQQGTAQAPNTWNDGRVYTLRYDGMGREFICVNGRRVYFDDANQSNQQQGGGQVDSAQAPPPPQEYRANRPLLDDQMTAPNMEQGRTDAAGTLESESNQSTFSNERNIQSNQSGEFSTESNATQSGAEQSGESQQSGSAQLDETTPPRPDQDQDTTDSASQADEQQNDGAQ